MIMCLIKVVDCVCMCVCARFTNLIAGALQKHDLFSPHSLHLSSYKLRRLTLSSPQLVPSTAPSSFEWQVVPTVHHSVLHTS